MLEIIVLVCATSTTPSDCDRRNAIDIVTVGRVSLPTQCGVLVQAALASSGVALDTRGAYEKIVCVRAPTER